MFEATYLLKIVNIIGNKIQVSNRTYNLTILKKPRKLEILTIKGYAQMKMLSIFLITDEFSYI